MNLYLRVYKMRYWMTCVPGFGDSVVFVIVWLCFSRSSDGVVDKGEETGCAGPTNDKNLCHREGDDLVWTDITYWWQWEGYSMEFLLFLESNEREFDLQVVHRHVPKTMSKDVHIVVRSELWKRKFVSDICFYLVNKSCWKRCRFVSKSIFKINDPLS